MSFLLIYLIILSTLIPPSSFLFFAWNIHHLVLLLILLFIPHFQLVVVPIFNLILVVNHFSNLWKTNHLIENLLLFLLVAFVLFLLVPSVTKKIADSVLQDLLVFMCDVVFITHLFWIYLPISYSYLLKPWDLPSNI